MSDTDLKAFNKVLKTLSAVRTTLSDEERAILDGFILNSELDEVSAHSMVSKAASSKVAVGKAASGKVASGKVASNMSEDEDVSAHSMVSKAATSQSGKISLKISLDKSGVYQLIDK